MRGSFSRRPASGSGPRNGALGGVGRLASSTAVAVAPFRASEIPRQRLQLGGVGGPLLAEDRLLLRGGRLPLAVKRDPRLQAGQNLLQRELRAHQISPYMMRVPS